MLEDQLKLFEKSTEDTEELLMKKMEPYLEALHKCKDACEAAEHNAEICAQTVAESARMLETKLTAHEKVWEKQSQSMISFRFL